MELIFALKILAQSAELGQSELLATVVFFAIGLVAAFFVIRWMANVGNAPKYNPIEVSEELAKPINPDVPDVVIAEELAERTRLINRTLIQFLPVPLVFFLVLFFAKEFITYFAVIIYSSGAPESQAENAAAVISSSYLIFSYLVHVGLSLIVGFGGVYMVKLVTKFPAFKAFFMGREHKLKDILATIGILALSVVWIYFVVSVIWKYVLLGFGWDVKEQMQLKALRENGSTLLWVATTLAVVVGAPIIEEILFRGFLYQFFRKHLSVMLAATIQGLIFAVMHMSLSALLPLWLLGVILALFVEKYRSLLPSMIAHAIFNGITVVTLLIQLN